MGEVKFFHLTQRSLAEAARPLLTQSLGLGWKVMVRGQNVAVLRGLDEALWREPADGFLPHGLAGGPHDAHQPVLLGSGAATNGADALILLSGEKVDPAEAGQMHRVWYLFEDADYDQMALARVEWKAVVAAGLVAEYWSDASGKWEKKAQSGGAKS